MVTVQIKDNSAQAKELVRFLRTIPYVKIEEELKYNPEFVKKVIKAKKGKSTLLDNNKTIWENLGLK